MPATLEGEDLLMSVLALEARLDTLLTLDMPGIENRHWSKYNTLREELIADNRRLQLRLARAAMEEGQTLPQHIVDEVLRA